MSNVKSIIWFRQDLRLADNPALRAAIEAGGAVLPVFIFAPGEEAPWEPGGASRWWLHQSLRALDAELRGLGSQLILRRGATLDLLRELIKETGARAVFWNRRYEPGIIARDKRVKASLLADGVEAKSFNGSLLHEPWEIENSSKRPFQVFTPFWKRCLAKDAPGEPLAKPKSVPAPAKWPKSETLESFKLEPKIDWARGFRAMWQPGEDGAVKHLKRFLAESFGDYDAERNRPDHVGTSRLSPHLHFGEISPRQIWYALSQRATKEGWPVRQWRESQYLTELGWREFSYHLLYHFPETPTEPLRAEFKIMHWRKNPEGLRAWQKGLTGYPIVDAGMRELWATGWMHNRVRMIVASFLAKDLMLPWQSGAQWFWDTLVDADLANNTLGWQWTAGCGADAAPYFRVFNPISQGEKFDPNGDYVRRWCPELAKVANKWIHQPHKAPAEVLRAGGVVLGRDYPEPMVNHYTAREVALEAYARMRADKKDTDGK